MKREIIIQFLGLMYWNFAEEDYITIGSRGKHKKYKRLFKRLYVIWFI